MTVICGILILALAGSLSYNNDLIKRNEMQRDIIMRMKEPSHVIICGTM